MIPSFETKQHNHSLQQTGRAARLSLLKDLHALPAAEFAVTTWISRTYLKKSEAIKTCDIHIFNS